MNQHNLTALRERLIALHAALAAHFAHEPHWWPILTNDPPFEVIVGMVLVQQTRWQMVEAAIRRLIERDWMSPIGLATADPAELALLIRPCAFHTQKAPGLQAIARHIVDGYAGNTAALLEQPPEPLRAELLALPRIGRETADTIMLYGGGHASFIVDAYARRILGRAGLPTSLNIERAAYDTLKNLVEQALASGPPPELPPERRILPQFITPRSVLTAFHWDFHALIVEASIHHCTATRQRCMRPGLRPAFVDDRKCAAHCRECQACPLSATCATYGALV
ncbi:MAG: DNA repair protein [Roseiflexaceae bacterium]|nr:DNA repair protein [Roseiflexaceae bacterium]